MIGDVDRDGVAYSSSDAEHVLNYVNGDESYTREQIKSMDVNGSNSVNLNDYNLIIDELN